MNRWVRKVNYSRDIADVRMEIGGDKGYIEKATLLSSAGNNFKIVTNWKNNRFKECRTPHNSTKDRKRLNHRLSFLNHTPCHHSFCQFIRSQCEISV